MAFVTAGNTAPLGRRDTFPYRRLADREIRLVIVKKHSRWPRSNSFTCTIRHVSIDTVEVSAPYVALSYTWGDGQDATSLELRDETTGKSGVITATSGIILALEKILGPGQRQFLWVDQICIDQSSAVEKSQQVQLMRLIYERSMHVYIWLGPASEDIDKALAYLRDSDTESLLWDFADASRERYTYHVSRGLTVLLHRPYWTRTWTVQEATALHSEQTTVVCGDSSVKLTSFLEWDLAIDKVELDPGRFAVLDRSTKDSSVYNFNRFQDLRKQSLISLPTLLRIIRSMEASDPRDKVHAMLNFATDMLHKEIKPDYTKTVRQTYTEVVLWCMRKYHSLDILGECNPSLAEDAAPSWVPDWRHPETVVGLAKTSNINDPTSKPLYRASGEYTSDIFVHKPLDIRSRLLLLSGVKISNLDVVLNQVPAHSDSWAAQRSWQPKDGGINCLLNGFSMGEVFRRTIFLDIKYELQDGKWRQVRGNEMLLPWNINDSELTPAEAATKSIIARTRAVGRCHFYTTPGPGWSQGLLGYGPGRARPSDELWMLKGGKVLYILRRKDIEVNSIDLGTGKAKALPVDVGVRTYELVGEAFVLGLMDGEIIDMLGGNPKRKPPPPLAYMDKTFRTIGLI